MTTSTVLVQGRYELAGKPVGQGGMGFVYKAYDTVTKRHVALKSLRGSLGPEALDLFNKEWSVLAHLSHPNIVDVLDIGQFEQDGQSTPFFVMPFLPGVPLDRLLASSPTRLTVERTVGIIVQTCRGLQAAHEQGVIHRDLKPSNIWVMDDDSVKIIDFGVAHLVGADSVVGLKGTIQYMAPEQVEMKPCSPASDVFSLAVVGYLALTGQRPFARESEVATVEAIRHYMPPAIVDLNPMVSQLVSRVIHKAMAKDPWHRFSTAREFSEALQMGLRGEAPERFDPGKIQPRIERAKKAHAEGDHQFASEILTELEVEGNVDPEMSLLRIQIDQAVRQKTIRQLLEGARTRLEEDEFPLALQKIGEILAIDPDNPDANSLRNEVVRQRGLRQKENWFRLVDQHIRNGSYSQARSALQEILKVNPSDTKAGGLLVEVDRRDREVERARTEKDQLYQGAMTCYQHGEVSSALTKLERILELIQRSPDAAVPDRDAQYQTFYNRIRTEREAARSAYAEGQQCLANRNFARALEICDEYLKRAPGDPLFQALKLQVEEHQRQEQSSFFADVLSRADQERDLDRRVNLLKEAVERCPDEPHLVQSLRLVRERRDLVNSIVERARQHEERGQFTEALSQFDILRNIYPQYPGLEFEVERLRRRRDAQVREESKGRWVEQIDRQIALGDYARARDLVKTALGEFPEDQELAGLGRVAEGALARAAEAEQWLQHGQKLCFDRQFREGIDVLRKAASLDARNPVIRAALLNALVEQARSVLGQDWRAAEPLIEEALSIDGVHSLAKSLQGLVLDYKRQEILNRYILQARELQANGDLTGALARVEEALASYPNENRLVQLRTTLQGLGAVSPARPSLPQPVETPAGPPRLAIQEEQALRSANTQPLPWASEPLAIPERPFTIDRSAEAPAVSPPEPQAPGAGRIALLQEQARQQLSRVWSFLVDYAKPTPHGSNLLWVGATAAVILLAMALVLSYTHKHRKFNEPAVAAQYLVALQSNVEAASYLVDGKPMTSSQGWLGPGAHRVDASAPGYKTDTQSFTLAPNGPKPFVVAFRLEPEPARLRLLSNLKAGKASYDGQPAVDLQDGNFTQDGISLSAGHTLSLQQSGQVLLAVSFAAAPGSIVTLTEPMKGKDIAAVLISNLGQHSRVYTSDRSLKGGLKDRLPQPIPQEGLELYDPAATTEITLDDGKSPRTFSMENGNTATLTILLSSDPNQSTVEVDVHVSGAAVSVDEGKPRTLHTGWNQLTMEPGIRTLRFTADGYEPSVQKVELKKGEVRSLPAIEFKPGNRIASLSIEGAIPDAEVWIDGKPVGVIGHDGSYSRSDISPGQHTILLQKADFEEKQLARPFTAGQSVRIAGPEGQLTAFGGLDFKVSPPGARISYQREDETQAHPAENGRSVRVRAGRYVVIASGNGNRSRQETVSVEPGRLLAVDWDLGGAPEESGKAPAAPPKQVSTPDYFQDASAWTQSASWWVHKGDGTTWLRANQGKFTIEFLRQTSKIGFIKKAKHVEFVADQKSAADFIDYTFDFNSLERRVTTAGRIETKKVKLEAAAATGNSYVLQIEISPERVVIRDASGQELDRYQRPNPADPLGKSGFKGEVAMAVIRAEER